LANPTASDTAAAATNPVIATSRKRQPGSNGSGGFDSPPLAIAARTSAGTVPVTPVPFGSSTATA
jgi:hypothetical protein